MSSGAKRALFLDRDGVINVDDGHVHRRERFEFKSGIFELCRAAQHLGYLLIVVTNQAGIARGYYSEADFHHLTNWMMDQFLDHDVQITRVYYCPFHPVNGLGEYKRDSLDRKPNPGMLLRAQSELNLDLASSILIGDQVSDMRAAAAAGVGTRLFLSSEATQLEPQERCCQTFNSLDEIRLKLFSSASVGGAAETDSRRLSQVLK